MYSDFVPLKDVSFSPLSLSLFLVFLCSTFRTIRSILWIIWTEDVKDSTCIFVRFFRAWIFSSFFFFFNFIFLFDLSIDVRIKMLKIDALESV